MAKRYANKEHLSWVHEFRCCLSTFDTEASPVRPKCNGYVQAHHLMRPWNGYRGMGLKANDKNLIPLCMAHHNALHARGDELAYFEEITGNSDFGKSVAESLWRISPFNEKD